MIHLPPEHEIQVHTRRSVRVVLVCAGVLLTAMGIAGVVLPLVPGMPFLILAAGCFARSNDRAYRWLLTHPVVGPSLYAWRTHRQIPRWVKPRAIAAVILAFSLSTWFALENPFARVAWMLLGLAVVVYIARLPAYDSPPALRAAEETPR